MADTELIGSSRLFVFGKARVPVQGLGFDVHAASRMARAAASDGVQTTEDIIRAALRAVS